MGWDGFYLGVVNADGIDRDIKVDVIYNLCVCGIQLFEAVGQDGITN